VNARRYFYVLSGVLLILVFIIFAAVIGGNSLLEDKAKKLSELKTENAAIEQQSFALRQAKIDIEKYNDLNEITKSIVPQDKDQAKTIREIINIANASGIPIESIAFESSNLGNTDKKTSSSTGGSKAKTPPVSQVKPVEGINDVYSLPIRVSSNGDVSYEGFLSFLERLEKNRRTAHVSNISLSPSNNGSLVDFELTLNAYLKPEKK
jgi:Tfp pilus assembly protein PilO